MLFFQILLWGLLVVPLLLLVAGVSLALVGFFAVLGLLVWCLFRLGKKQQMIGGLLVVAHALISAFLLLALLNFIQLWQVFTIALLAWLALFAYFQRCCPFMDATVLGYDSGYAIVQVHPSLVSWIHPGVYAVNSRKVKRGRIVQVRFDMFTKKGFVK